MHLSDLPIVHVGNARTVDEDDAWVGVDAGTIGFVDHDAIAEGMPEGDWYNDVFDPDEGVS